MNIAVIDSGINMESPFAKECVIEGGIEISENEQGEIVYSSNLNDELGHGTAVTNAIVNLIPECHIIPIKIIKDKKMPDCNLVCEALRYIYENVDCDIINLSAGIVCCSERDELYDCCKKLCDKGVIIVSAYDNDEAVAYPAAFDCVIGVQGTRTKFKNGYYMRVAGENADFMGCSREKRLYMLTGYEVCSGNSFLTAEFVERVAKLKQRGLKTFREIVDGLNAEASRTIDGRDYKALQIPFEINRAIVFPFNKEMQVLARLGDRLKFEVVDFYDSKYSPNIGVKIGEICHMEDKRVVKAIKKLDWESDFDTVILGHTTLLSNAAKFNYEEYIVEQCKKYHKKLVSCRDIRNLGEKLQGLEYYCPYVDAKKLPDFLNMHVISTPVVGVVGTGSSQGKFTLQIELRAELEKQGYRVAQIGTEPTAQLFGMECVYPMGHESAVYPKGFQAVYELNCMLGYLQSLSPDIILYGSQANTVPFVAGGAANYPVVQHELVLGCQADAYILCVSDDAPVDYIKRTISYLEGVYPSKVIALYLSSLSIKSRFSAISAERKLKTEQEMNEWKQNLQKEIALPLISSRDTDHCAQLVEVITDYFS